MSKERRALNDCSSHCANNQKKKQKHKHHFILRQKTLKKDKNKPSIYNTQYHKRKNKKQDTGGRRTKIGEQGEIQIRTQKEENTKDY